MNTHTKNKLLGDLCGLVRVIYSVAQICLSVAVLKNLINLSTADTATQKSELLQVWDSWIRVM